MNQIQKKMLLSLTEKLAAKHALKNFGDLKITYQTIPIPTYVINFYYSQFGGYWHYRSKVHILGNSRRELVARLTEKFQYIGMCAYNANAKVENE